MFLVAAELYRRGYVASMTMQRTEQFDLLVSKESQVFHVDVKGLSSNSDWLIRYRENVIENLYYILVRIGKAYGEDRFFIMRHSDVNKELKAYYDKRGVSVTEKAAQGFSFKQAMPYENRWDILGGINIE
jgi:hypothetical protein